MHLYMDKIINRIKTVVVDVSGKFLSLTKGIAKELDAEGLTLPKDESLPETGDTVIIVGEDHAE